MAPPFFWIILGRTRLKLSTARQFPVGESEKINVKAKGALEPT